MRSFVLAVPFAIAVTTPSRAHAAPKVAVDVDAVAPIDAAALSVGFGVQGRFGYEIKLPLVAITPEVGGGYAAFGGGTSVGRGFLGGRVTLFEGVRPGAFVHVGYGGLSGGGASGASFDAGGLLEMSLLPFVDLGVHGAFTTLDAAKWVAAGGHLAIVF